ncbi:GLPGLI family protein [Ulvibacter sp. MAR_2010_11]|uniref:GLPGLI family protein n=1 Tax=Ulvibacter sp. MAR_2010_11 TaxID=1250229 RepID=UPI000C2CAC87|nr:GLPGLI family protein [Ulvibacter sp. MAR_2010_11]PKA83350.1 GLPGLI family protein [Ulvibacter sp. MAR_2010_11]
MKFIISYSLVYTLAMATAIAQEFQGIAYYKTHREINLSLDSTRVNSDTQKHLQGQIQRQFQKEYTLSFKGKESVYKEIESLEKPSVANVSGEIKIVVGGMSDVLYRNLKDNFYVQETEIMDKQFLIKDTLKPREWKLEKETKSIGEYTCFKAIFSEEIIEQIFSTDSNQIEKVTKTRTTTAWYTLQIPLSHGPQNFWGLPGLILEVNDGEQSMLCSKIILNPKKEIEILVPSKGKPVTQVEYDIIREKKNKEMMENMGDNRSNKGGNTVIMKIGG